MGLYAQSTCYVFSAYTCDQEWVNNYNRDYAGCDVLYGTLVFAEDVTSLDSLYKLKELRGSLEIFHTQLTDLSGLENLEVIEGKLVAFENNQLKSLSGLENLKTLGGVLIHHNKNLESVSLSAVNDSLSSYEVYNNTNLRTISGLNGMTYIEKVRIENNDSLRLISGMNNLYAVHGGVSIINNYSVDSLDIFRSLDQVRDDFIVRHIYGVREIHCFDNLRYCGKELRISNMIGGVFDYFPNLEHIRSLNITGNNITELRGFNKLKELGGLEISGATGFFNLHLIDGFNALETVRGELFIRGFTSDNFKLLGFNTLKKVGHLIIDQIDNLEEFTAFSSLEEIEQFGFANIENKKSDAVGNIKNLDNFSNLKRVEKLGIIKCQYLENIDALANVKFTNQTGSLLKNGISIVQCPRLSWCSLPNICQYVQEHPDLSDIRDTNKEGCNSIEEILDRCVVSTTDVSEEITLKPYNIYPNPTIDRIWIESEYPVSDITVYNNLGMQVRAVSGSGQSIHLGGLPGGMYIVRFTLDDRPYSERVVVVR